MTYESRGPLYELRLAGVDEAEIGAILGELMITLEAGGRHSPREGADPRIVRLLHFLPLTPLTGEPDEWTDVSESVDQEPGTYFQNRRCPSVFKFAEVVPIEGIDAVYGDGTRSMALERGFATRRHVAYDAGQNGAVLGHHKLIESFPYLPPIPVKIPPVRPVEPRTLN